MPLVYQQNINESAQLAVWMISEEASFFVDAIGFSAGISHPQKKLQFLAGRYLLKRLAPLLDLQGLEFLPSGKPFDPAGKTHFSISHCQDRVAVLVSSHGAVGVDIQIPLQKLLSLQHKFISDQERLLLSVLPMSDVHQICFGWSVKETLYKWYGKGQLNFLHHLRIEDVQLPGDSISFGCRLLKDGDRSLLVSGSMLNEDVLTLMVSR